MIPGIQGEEVEHSFHQIEAKAAEMNKLIGDQMADYFAAFWKSIGQGCQAEAAEIEKKFKDLASKVWKDIATAQEEYSQLQLKMERHKGVPVRKRCNSWTRQRLPLIRLGRRALSFLDFTQKYAQPQALDIAHQQTYGKQAIEIAGINEQYQKLVGITSEQYAAQLKVTQATEQYNEVAYSGNAKLLTAMKQLNDEQQRRLTIQSSGTFGQNLGLVVGDQMRNMGGNFYYATQTANVLNSSLDKLNDSLLKLLDTSHMTSIANEDHVRTDGREHFVGHPEDHPQDAGNAIYREAPAELYGPRVLSLAAPAARAGASAHRLLPGIYRLPIRPTFGLPTFAGGGMADSPSLFRRSRPEALSPFPDGGPFRSNFRADQEDCLSVTLM